MKFLANENIPFSSITYLKSQGIDIKSIGVDNPSITDREVMEIAIKEDRIIITYDSDYGELIFKLGYSPEAGVIYIRPQPKSPLETAEIISKLISNENLSFGRSLTVVDSKNIRQKKY